MAKNKKTSDDRRKKLQELVEERNQDANSFFSGNENVTRENIGQKRKEDSNNFKKESAKRKTISSSSNQSNNYTYSSRNNDYELPMINNNENRFQLPTVNRPQMPTMNFQSRARRNSSFTGINLNENSLKDKQKETSRKVFEALNPGKKLIFGNSQYFGKGNIDLNNRKVLRNEDGSISTEQSMSFGDENGNEILVPTIINGKKVSDDEAIKHYYKTGEYLGKFRTIEEAEKYAQELHNRQDKYYNNKETQNTLPTKENLSKIFKDVIKTETKGLVPYVLENYKQGLLEGTAGIGQGQILSASNEAKKISEKSNKDKLKDLNETMLRTLNPIYGITKKSFEIGQNTLDTLRNKDKTAKEKVADILTSGVSGVKDMNNPIGDVVKLSGKTAGIINNKAGDKLLELNEKIDKPLRENREKLQEEGQNYSNAVRMAGTVSNVVGNMTPSIIASRLGGGNEALSQALSLGTMGLSVKGRATQEALNKGAELDKAIKIGDTKAMTEVGTELLTGGLNIFGKGALDDIVKRGINRKVESKVLNYLAKQGAGIAGEVGEETISDILNTVIDQGTVDPNATYSMKDWSDTALTTMLSTVVLNSLGGAYTPRAYNQNVQEMEQYKAKQDITERINNSNLSEEDKSNMLDYVENEDFTQADYNAMRETIENSEQPTDTISTVGFQKLTSDEWINEINKAVNEARNNQEQNGNSNQSSFIMPTSENTKKEVQLPKVENNTQKTKGEPINWNEIERPEGKFRKHYQSIIQSSNTTAQAKAIARELMEADTYIPESNKNQLQRADERIQTNGADKELTTLSTNVDNGSKITSVDIAVGERLIEYYSKIGNKAKLQEAIQTTAMAGTQAGQTVQALALLNHQTPQGQVTWIQRSVDKLNKELKHKKGDKAKQFEFTPEMQQKILNAKDKQEMNNVIDEVYQELGQQVPKSFIEKLDSWRYFSMLANPRTHIRNIVGNFAMGKMQGVKNKVAGAIEDTMSLVNKDMERTHTLKRASKETKQFAKNDLNNVDIQTRLELNENKYNPKSRIENSQRTFKSDALEKTIGKAFNFNDTALEAEDGFGLKHAYVKALSEYMTANKLTPETITEKQLAKARNHAIEEAKEATFHSKNAIATAINQFSRKNKLTKYTTDAILPFVKTPMNVAKAGLEYNPTGLIKTLTVDSVKLRKGNISVNKYIDNLSKGLTGTGLAVLGYAMAKAGILKASGGDDDKKEKYDEALGRQAYSLEINGKTFSLDWLAPAGIPLFVGAEAQNIKSQGEKEKKSISSDDDSKSKQIMESLENWANAMSNSISPMSEMSMISGLTSALKSYDNDSQKMLGTMATNSLKSYVNQFVPTALGQLARTTDEYERNTTSTKTGVLSKPIDQVKLQVMSKIPGLRQKLPTKSDIWGNEVKQQANIPFRAFNNFVNPSIIKDVSINEVDNELNSLYSKTKESSIIPKSIEKTLAFDGTNYRMTNEEYAKYNKNYGETSYNLIKGLVTSRNYKDLTGEQKQRAIENVYKYAKEQNKVDYAEQNNLKVETTPLYNTMKALEKGSGNQSDYLDYISKTTGTEIKEKQKVNDLYNANYDTNTKDIIYSNTIGKDDETYNKIKKDNISINSYLKYKDTLYKETDKKKASGELDEGQNLKSVDKIKILLNNNFSDNEKKSFYSNTVADDEVYSKLLKDNIDVNEYLNFKEAQLSEKLASDKDKYGQAKRGTAKEKFFKYINKNISGYENKLIIAGKNYKLSNTERKKLVNIIDNATQGKERIEMYKKFSNNFIVNGNKIYYK